MNFALTQEVSELIIKNGVSDYIKQISDSISGFIEKKDYGEDLQSIYIGIICVSPEFDFFFKIRKPKYKNGKEIVIQDDRPYELISALVYDVKLDHEKYVRANENEVKKMLSIELLNSLTAFNSVKIKAFDRKRFESDIEQHLNQYIQ